MKRAFYKPRLVTRVIFSLLFFCSPAIYAFEEVPIIPRCKSLEPQEGFYPLQQQIRISITGADAQGVFYGLQSLKQMLPAAIFDQDDTAHREAFSDLRIGFVKIEDVTRFKWRGFMLDSSRHIQTVEKIKQYIDLMALYKMNVFHWHLTDDEAWRAEIKKYPKLTSIGGYPGDRSKDEELNGYYTQEQMREIVAYAHERYIKVVPEFDIPGHVNALLMAYPEHGCNKGGPLKMGEPGMRSFSSAAGRRAICAGKHETTIPFIMEVFEELQTIFTDGLFHVGGDERPRGNWEKCTHCVALRNKQKLKDEHHLQNWFLNEVSERLRKRGIRTVGWAEHIQGGVPEGQIVFRLGTNRQKRYKGFVQAERSSIPIIGRSTSIIRYDRSDFIIEAD